MRVLYQVLLFALAPFFVYPWKPIINMIAGDSYEVALKHFKTGHYGGVNLTGHAVCLFIQLFGNFGLLNVLDQTVIPQPIAGVRIFSAISALLWSGYLIPTKAPPLVTTMSLASIASAYAFTPQVSASQFEVASIATLLTSIAASNFVFAKKKVKQPLGKWLSKVLLIPLLFFGARKLSETSYAGSQAPNVAPITAGVLGLLAAVAATPNPVKKVVVGGMLITRVASILTNSTPLFYLSMGFAASFFQGILHAITDEEATLIAVGDEGGHDALAFEYAHVVYFPNIALHTVYDAVVGKKHKVK